MSYSSVNTLHYQKFYLSRKSRWVVFIHGAGGNSSTWRHQIDPLKTHFNLLLIDLRDHGGSKNIQPDHAKYNFNIVVEDIKNLMTSLGIANAHFITLSFGSVIAQAVYNQRPELVDRMILIGGVFNANWMIKGFVHLARFLNLFLTYSQMYKAFSYLLMPRKASQPARRLYQREARKLSQQEYLKWLGLYSEFFLMLKSFHDQNIEDKALILMGEHDYLFLPSARKFMKRHSGSQMSIVPTAGHIVNIERPEETNDLIIDFLIDHTN